MKNFEILNIATNELENMKLVFNTHYVGINRVEGKDVRATIVKVEKADETAFEMFDKVTFKVTGFNKRDITVTVQVFGGFNNHYHAMDLIIAELREGNFTTVDCLATEEQKEALTQIINKANTKPQKFNKCTKCGGTGEWVGTEGRTGNCFNCGKHKKGHNPNKWMQIRLDAESLLNMHTKLLTDEQLKDFDMFSHLRPMFEESLANKINTLVSKIEM